MPRDFTDLHQALYDEAYELACRRAREEGDVDIDYDYTLMEAWINEYYVDLCKDEGVEPHPDYVL